MLRLVLLLCLSFVALAADLQKADRIFDGEEVKPNSVPFMVALETKSAKGVKFCGGAIISRYVVITSARCIFGAKYIEIILGAHDLTTNEKSQKRYNTTLFTIHEGYKRNSIKNDIAVIGFPREVRLEGNIRKVKMLRLSEEDIDLVGQTGQAYGWGGDGLISSDKLQMVDLKIQPLDECKEVYGKSLTDKQMCTKGDKKNFCRGDEGGPVVIDGKLVGIMSTPYNYGCEYDQPTIVTRVSKYLKWISEEAELKIKE